jgi:signal transduction histidine kinase
MRLKTKLVLAITSLVFFISGALSLVYVSQLLHLAVHQTYDANRMVASQLRMALQSALEKGLRGRVVDPQKPEELRALEAKAVLEDETLATLLDSINRYSLTVYDVNIADGESVTMLSTNPDNEEKPLPARPDYQSLIQSSSLELMSAVFGPPKVYELALAIERNGKPFASVHVGVRTTLLKAVYEPWLLAAFTLMGLALATALIAAFLLSNIALHPLEEISRQLDAWIPAGKEPEETQSPQPKDTATLVSAKIERFGQRMRNVEEVYSTLQGNLDQILSNLEDGVLLFTRERRAVLVSEPARRLLGKQQENLVGLRAEEIFDRSTTLGATLYEAYETGARIDQQEIRTESGRRVQVSLEFIQDQGSQQALGALATLRDLESVEKIGSDLELSRRMAAIGRLTSGVGHEIKNPINAIVVHLELLKNKLSPDENAAARHLEIIESEIRRLDRAVQLLADFTRPVELQLCEHDLRQIVDDVLSLAADELTLRGITLTSRLPERPILVSADVDLLKQAILNVVQNGSQAMPEGGALSVYLETEQEPGLNEPHTALLRIADQGPGIPDEVKEKIFDLYFTTKPEGSGIGLAMTYRILQLHHGGVEVQSELGTGAEFLLRLPILSADGFRRRYSAGAANEKGPAQ